MSDDPRIDVPLEDETITLRLPAEGGGLGLLYGALLSYRDQAGRLARDVPMSSLRNAIREQTGIELVLDDMTSFAEMEKIAEGLIKQVEEYIQERIKE